MNIEQNLERLGITLPTAQAPAANYVPFVQTGNLVVISGQLPMMDGKLIYSGKLGEHLRLEDGQDAARLCGINLLAQLRDALSGNLGRIERCVRLGGFVSCTAEFTQQPQVINGASDLIAEALGDRGKHARAAVGCPSLPFDAAVEVEGMFEVS